MEKIRVIKQKKKDKWDTQKYNLYIGGIDLSRIVSGVTATLNAENPNLTEVNIKLITDDFEWKDSDEE